MPTDDEEDYEEEERIVSLICDEGMSLVEERAASRASAKALLQEQLLQEQSFQEYSSSMKQTQNYSEYSASYSQSAKYSAKLSA